MVIGGHVNAPHLRLHFTSSRRAIKNAFGERGAYRGTAEIRTAQNQSREIGRRRRRREMKTITISASENQQINLWPRKKKSRMRSSYTLRFNNNLLQWILFCVLIASYALFARRLLFGACGSFHALLCFLSRVIIRIKTNKHFYNRLPPSNSFTDAWM